jgi:hypothetical protein
MCAKKALTKVANTEERKQVQKELREFFRRNPDISFRELRPTGFQIDIGTIPEDKVEEFLNITNKLNK